MYGMPLMYQQRRSQPPPIVCTKRNETHTVNGGPVRAPDKSFYIQFQLLAQSDPFPTKNILKDLLNITHATKIWTMVRTSLQLVQLSQQ